MAAWELEKTILKNSSNLRAYYRLEAGSLTTDSSGNGFNLTNNNGVSEGTGYFGGGADFGTNNINKYLSTTNTLGIDDGAITLSCWVKLNTEITSNHYSFVEQVNNTSKVGYQILYDYNSGARRVSFLRVKIGVIADQINYSVNMGTSSWYHLALVYNGSTLFGYVNGSLIGSVSSTGNGTSSAFGEGLYIGADKIWSSLGMFANTLIDDVAIFNTALTADQIKELYEGRTIGEFFPQSNLVGLWHLNGNSNDSSGNGYNMTDDTISYGSSYGNIIQGASFNGTSSIMRRLNTLQFTGNFSIGLYVKFNSVASDMILVVNELTGSYFAPYEIRLVSSSTKIQFSVVGNPSGSQLVTSITTVGTGNWYHLFFTRDGTNINLYLNGRLESSSSWSTQQTTNSGNYLQFGGTQSGSNKYRLLNGSLDEISFFDRALSASEIRKWYAWSTGKLL